MRLYQRLKRQILSQVHLVRVALGLAILAGVVAVGVVVKPVVPQIVAGWQAIHFSLPTRNGRTNFLILGREGPSTGSGQNRAGTDLTDTMILVSVHQSGDTVLLSIPRDMWIPSLRAKINTAYYYGEQRQPGSGGIVLAKAAVEEVIGQPVHYAVVIDFLGFEKMIDLLGGVDIDVERSFVDHKFPLAGKENDECDGDPQFLCRYETIQFFAGRQHMDGRMALKYVRSRQAEGDEGTDFARSRRQEKLVLAIRSKLLSRPVITNLKLLRALYQQMAQSVVTDMTSQIYPALAKVGLRAIKHPMRTGTLTEPDWVYHPQVTAAQDWQWVLLPAADLSAHIKNLLAVEVQK